MARNSSLVLSIPSPCQEDWNEMLPAERGKYCLSCQQQVIDFSVMADSEVVRYFKEYPGSCGRFSTTQLNPNLVASAPRHSFFRLQYSHR